MSTYLSWPFAAILGVPIAADILFRKQKWTFFIKWSVISTITILIPQILIDSYYYGKTTFASFNIVKYNVLTGNYYSLQCENFIIFLSFRFFVKSILVVLEVQYLLFYHNGMH